MEIYIGPLVRIRTESYEYMKPKKTCPNQHCDNHATKLETEFCPLCGSPRTKMEFSQSACKDYDEFLEEPEYEHYIDQLQYNESLNTSHYLGNTQEETLIDNYSNKMRVKLEEGDSFSLDYVKSTQEADLEQFYDRHSQLLSDMRDFFGVDNVFVEYGIAVYRW